jgi:acetyltransferase-like isoleucine patch superfamily enzyme
MLLDHRPGCAIGSGVSVCTCGAIGRAMAEVPMIDTTAYIDAKASVGHDVTIGSGTKVWADAKVIRGAKIGVGCVIGDCAMVDAATVGDYSKIQRKASIHPGVVLGKWVFVGPGVETCNDAFPRADDFGFDGEALLSGRLVTIRVCDGASIGAHATIMPGVTIGERAMIAAGAVCSQDVPADHMLKRSGEIVEINTAWAKRRMKRA